MKNVTVSNETFTAIVNAGDNSQIWEAICDNEANIMPYMPTLAGGLDHIVITKKQIEIHDRGCSNGSRVIDNSFRIRIKK